MSFISNITSRIIALHEFRKRQLVYFEYRDVFKERLKQHGVDPEQKAEGEEEYMRLWKKVCPRIEPYSYRFFSRYMGVTPYVIPEDIGRTYIEYYLNPLRYRAFYSDKNLYEQYLRPTKLFPKVYFRRVANSCLMDADFHPSKAFTYQSTAEEFAKAMPVDRAVLKRTNDSGGGHAVQCIERKEDGLFYSNKGYLIDGTFLSRFAPDWNIQEVIEQHPFFAQFSQTSLNSLRICLYRSVVDEEVIIYSTSLRIGHNGSFVDNLTQGGGFVKIDIPTGKIIGKVYDEQGFSYDTINDVDFSKEYIIPEWDKILETAKSITKQIHHCRLVALDLCLDKDNQIRMIEHNIGDNSYWWTMYMGINPFGERVEEMINYCIEQRKNDPRFQYLDR